MTTPNDGGPAFPHDLGHLDAPYTGGLSVRDYFAAKALQGWMATYGEHRHPASDGSCDITAKWAYDLADAMLKARATQPG